MRVGCWGYGAGMTEMGHHEHDSERLDLGGTPKGEEVSEADVEERLDADPEEQENQHDPVLDEDDEKDDD